MSGVTEWICPNCGVIHKWYDGTCYLGESSLNSGPNFCPKCGSKVERKTRVYDDKIYSISGGMNIGNESTKHFIYND